MKDILIETQGLKKYFPVGKGFLHAVDGVNIKIERGKTLGVVGESGCGKSTLGRTILKMYEPTEGRIMFEGKDITNYRGKKTKELRTKMQMIFQDPYSSLNPRMSVQELIAEPILINSKLKNRADVYRQVSKLMDTVGLAQRLSGSYPHELDGGRRQRIGVARALSVNPEFIVCDEPVSALDVSIQAQILNLLMDLQDDMGLTYMFITHDLSVVKHIANDIAVMYPGQCIELADKDEIFENPKHPYTKALLSAIPVPNVEMYNREIETIKGEITSPIDPKGGCRFAPRCPLCEERCMDHDIELSEYKEKHFVACVHAGR